MVFTDKYIEEVLKGFSIETSKSDPLSFYALVYAKLCTRLGIFYCKSHEQILVESRLGALDYCKNILKYLRSIKELFLIFEEGLELRVGEYTDADGRISTSVCILEFCWFDILEGFQAIDQWKPMML